MILGVLLFASGARFVAAQTVRPGPLSSPTIPLYWDTSGTTAGLQAGNGNWSTMGGGVNVRWSTTSAGTALVNWTNADSAFFETSGTSLVTVNNVGMTVDSMTFDGTGYTIGPGGGALSLVGTGNITTNADAAISAALGGSIGLTKLGNSILTLSGANTYTGSTTVNAGTLTVDNNTTTTARLANTSAVTVNSGSTVLLTQSGATASTDRINNSATVNLAGGTLKLNGVSEGTSAAAGVGALTLASSSKINLAGTSLLHFAASNGQTWSGTLSIYNWSGTLTGGGAEQLLFGTSAQGLTPLQLSEFQFYSDAGQTAYLPGAVILSTGEVVPDPVLVPEPSTLTCEILGLGVIAYTQRRRFIRKRNSG
jgi:autotransporter-associated beta strand protein